MKYFISFQFFGEREHGSSNIAVKINKKIDFLDICRIQKEISEELKLVYKSNFNVIILNYIEM